jgi:magnesium transporter
MVKVIRIKTRTEDIAKGAIASLVEKNPKKAKVWVFEYNEGNFKETFPEEPETLVPPKEGSLIWINVDGLYDKDFIEKICCNFKIHPLVVKDLLNNEVRPKTEDLGDYLFIVMEMLYLEKNEIIIEHLSIVLGKNFILTFQERPGDVFDPIRDQIRTGKGRLRTSLPDYFVYKFIDAVVNNYFVILDSLRERIENIEENVVLDPNPDMLKVIHLLKKELVFIRKLVWPVRELVNDLQSSESPLIQETTTIYLKDLYYHVLRVVDTIELIHDIVSDTLDIYLSSISVKTNAVMKVLTVIATIFMPLTFLAGIYGMNFHDMPELSTWWGYPMVWFISFSIGISMLLLFWRKKWL